MRHFLSEDCALKRLEKPSLYQISTDELFELDEEAFGLLLKCSGEDGCEVHDEEFLGYCLDEGILRAEKPGKLISSPQGKSPEPSLRYLELQITTKCNLRCRHCFLGPAGKTELSIERIAAVLDEFQRMQGLRVLITGGEPLLYSYFSRLNDLLPGYALRKVLFTNGTLLGRELLMGLNVEEIQVSMDGLEKAHDALRGKGTFKKTMQSIEKALSEGYEVSVSTMVHAGNLGDFQEMERLFTGLGVRDWSVDVPCEAGNLKENPEFRVSPEEAGRCLEFGFGAGLHGGSGESGFSCGHHLMSVMADGSCAKCAFYYKDPAGRIEEGLVRCWERIEHIPLKDLECDCEYLESCRGGCRYRAETLGSPLGKDLYRCRFYDRMALRKEVGP
jgi:radical SAM protein with 4Fe4S-binding SPASM domain